MPICTGLIDGVEGHLLFKVDGMSCSHCVNAVTGAVQGIDPAAHVTVNLQSGQVQVDSTAAESRVAGAIAAEGYDVAVVPGA